MDYIICLLPIGLGFSLSKNGRGKSCRKAAVDRICGVWLSLCVCVRLASRVCVCLASACICLACVSRLSASVSRASVCVCSRQGFRMRASARVCLASACICLACVSRLSASVSRASVCVCSRQGFRMRASARVCLRRSSCLASVSHLSRVGRLVSRLASVSRLSVCPCECLRELAHFMRRSSFKRFLLSSYYRCTYRLCRLYEQTFNILI